VKDTAAQSTLADTVLDPVPVGMTAPGVTKLCDDALERATSLLDEIHALADGPDEAISVDAVLGKLDEIHFATGLGSGAPHLLAEVHPEADVREAARACEPRFDEFETNLMLDAKLAAAVERVAAKAEALSGPSRRLLEHTQRDLRRNGLKLPPEGQKRLRELNDELTRAGQAFSKNIAEATDFIEVDPASLAGLPDEYVAAKLKAKLPNGKVRITTSYPDYFPFIRYAEDREAAQRLFAKFENRAADANLPLLDKILRLREEKAHLLGYPTWADYVLEPRMAKDAKTVREFLETVRDAVREPAERELELFRNKQRELGRPVDPLYGSERLYLEEKLRAERFGLDSKELSKYFEVGRVWQGLLDIVAELYSLEVVRVDLPVWHEEVEVFELREKGKAVGRLYLDLFPRENKFQHAAVFGVRPSKRLADGSRVLPISTLVCNFPRPGEQPALLTHDEVVTFFHELGHVMHQLLTESPYSAFSGTSTARDFVETPSQMLEEWAYRREVLDRFARHYETGAPIPDDLFAALTRSRGFGRALATQRQLFFAALDLEYHTRPAGFDTTAVLEEIHRQYQPFAHMKGTHFQASFGHLIGYDAGYYGYQWALSLSRDVLTRFESEGMMNAKVARDFRDTVLSPGGSEDETAMVERFLGRKPNAEAYIAFLRAGLSAA